MIRYYLHLFSSGLILTILITGCGGAAAPSPTPTKPPPASVPTATALAVAPTAAAATAASTPTQTPTPTTTATNSAAKASGKVTIVVSDAGAEPLDPHKLVGGSEAVVSNPTFESMLAFDLDGTLIGHLATEWRASEGATVWEYKLRPGVKFHNGLTFTAEDVKFSYEKSAKEPQATELRLRVGSIEVVDPQTVRFRLKTPFAIWDTNGSGTKIVPKAYVEQIGASEFAKAPVGTGPYRFVDRRLNEFATFEAFEGHWRRPPFVKQVTLRFAAESAVRTAMLKTGEADIVGGVTPSMALEIGNTPGLRTLSAKGTSMMWIWGFGASKTVNGLPVNKPESPWANKLVRQALNYAIDRDAIVKGIFRGDAEPMVTPVMPGAFGFNPNLKPYPYDPKKAMDLLAQAGYPNGFTTDLYMTPHAAIAFTEDTTVAAAKMWADVGVKANIQKMDYGTYLVQVRERKLDGAGVIATVFQPNAWQTVNAYGLSGRSWTSMLVDPTVAPALDEAATEPDPGKRRAMFQSLVAQDLDLASNVFLVYGNTSYGVNARIKEWPQRRGYGYVDRVDLVQLVGQ